MKRKESIFPEAIAFLEVISEGKRVELHLPVNVAVLIEGILHEHSLNEIETSIDVQYIGGEKKLLECVDDLLENQEVSKQ